MTRSQQIAETIWILNRQKICDTISKMDGTEMPRDCERLVCVAFCLGAEMMGNTIGRGRS